MTYRTFNLILVAMLLVMSGLSLLFSFITDGDQCVKNGHRINALWASLAALIIASW